MSSMCILFFLSHSTVVTSVCVCVSLCSVCAGRPGTPGGSDLTSALRRLTLRRQNFLCERQYFQAEKNRKLQELSDGVESEGGESGCSSPMGSVRSSFTNLSEFSVSSSCFKTFLPEKLQIVKPMEGEILLTAYAGLHCIGHINAIINTK